MEISLSFIRGSELTNTQKYLFYSLGNFDANIMDSSLKNTLHQEDYFRGKCWLWLWKSSCQVIVLFLQSTPDRQQIKTVTQNVQMQNFIGP